MNRNTRWRFWLPEFSGSNLQTTLNDELLINRFISFELIIQIKIHWMKFVMFVPTAIFFLIYPERDEMEAKWTCHGGMLSDVISHILLDNFNGII